MNGLLKNFGIYIRRREIVRLLYSCMSVNVCDMRAVTIRIILIISSIVTDVRKNKNIKTSKLRIFMTKLLIVIKHVSNIKQRKERTWQ